MELTGGLAIAVCLFDEIAARFSLKGLPRFAVLTGGAITLQILLLLVLDVVVVVVVVVVANVDRL